MKKRFKNSWFWHSGCPTGSAKARQTGLLWRAQKATVVTGWLDCGFHFHALPCGRAQTRKPTFFYPSTLNPMSQQ
jgi:hypothetical protein